MADDATRDARAGELDALYVGGGPMPRLDGPVLLVPHDPAWARLFAREEQRIRGILGDRVLVLEHAGSTSVPELPAKPVIDIVLALTDPADEGAYVPQMEQAGYRLVIREPEWYEHRLFKGPDTNINLHVFPPGSPEIRRMLAFRDRLRTHPEEREAYAAAKLDLAARTWAYTQDYADAKGEVVEAIIARALAAAE